jgi:hypothetical protein
MSSADEQTLLEGGVQPASIAEVNHEGGDSAAQIVPPVEGSGANSANNSKGAESAPLTGFSAVPGIASAILSGGKYMQNFAFPPPFPAPANAEDMLAVLRENLFRQNQAPAMSSTPPPAELPEQVLSQGAVKLFSQMSASDLAKVVADEVQSLDTGLWITEDVSGAAIIGHVAPSALNEFLENVLQIKSNFLRIRIKSALLKLIQLDSSLSKEVRDNFCGNNVENVPPLAQNLFQTPVSGGAPRLNLASSTPAFFSCARTEQRSQQQPHLTSQSTPSFLRECGSSEDFSLEDNSLFANTARASLGASNMQLGGQAAVGGGVYAITINQPSANPPKYIILECASNSEAFYDWVRKNRKETLLALPVDRRTLSQLVSHDVKDEVARILKHLGPSNTFYFNEENSPYPRCWPEVTDHLLLKILFGINGPRSAAEAKNRLKQRLFYFNDSTTSQDKFTTKLRKFFSDFRGTLKDFAYTYHMWDANANLDHSMIVEAFNDCFGNVDQIKGPDGSTMVPKSRNYAKIREMIRERKSQNLEEIMNFIIDSFERNDIAVRSSKSITYDVKPWRRDGDDSGKKRQINQISHTDRPQNARPPRPAAEHPRCANCGRKSHLCGERSCYLFGHPQGRGASGTWAEGEPSLFIPKEDMKTWKVTRDPVFYGYPENKREPKSKKMGA